MLVRPTHLVPHVTDIDLDALWAAGVRGFIFDLDNTLMPPHTGVLDDPIAGWLKHIAERGFQSVVVSNNPVAVYTQAAAKTLNLPVIGNAGKPRRRFLRAAAEQMGLQPSQVVVVGDRPLTDIWGGQRMGAKTVLVDPLIKATENRLFKVLRWLERLCVIAATHPNTVVTDEKSR